MSKKLLTLDKILLIERGEYLGYSLRTLEKVALATGTHLNCKIGQLEVYHAWS